MSRKERVKEKAEQQALELFIWGNPSRGDDAIGPTMYQIIKRFIIQHKLENIQLIEDFQLQPEHICDMNEKACIVFIDAGYQGDTAYKIVPVIGTAQMGYTTHAMSPNALITLYQTVHNTPCPPAFQLSVRGYCFELGMPLSQQAEANMALAMQFVKNLLTCPDPLRLLRHTAQESSYA
ncbi:MAG: hydrogenase maturation protease [Psychromonas sp.]|nr:hydrogenase maturation protease [Psychromonas sp.]